MFYYVCLLYYRSTLYFASQLLYFSILFHVLRDGAHSASFVIPWTKSTKELGATVILTAHHEGDPLCLVTAFKNHLDVNSSVPPSSTPFTYMSSSTEPKNLLKHEFLDFITHIWSSAKLTHVLGHSSCIGGAVELLLTGVPSQNCHHHWRLDIPGFSSLLAPHG